MPRTPKTTEPTVIANPVTLAELRGKTGIIAPDMVTVLSRYGYGDKIGRNHYDESAVSVETAASFLNAYDVAKSSRASKVEAYRAYRREKAAKERHARTEVLKAQHARAVELEKKRASAAAIERDRLKLEHAEKVRAENSQGLMSFEEFEALEE